jgi:hypothetical protein
MEPTSIFDGTTKSRTNRRVIKKRDKKSDCCANAVIGTKKLRLKPATHNDLLLVIALRPHEAMPISCSVKRALEILEWTGWRTKPVAWEHRRWDVRVRLYTFPENGRAAGATLNYRKHHWRRRPPGPRAPDQIQCEVTDTSIPLPGLVSFCQQGRWRIEVLTWKLSSRCS